MNVPAIRRILVITWIAGDTKEQFLYISVPALVTCEVQWHSMELI